MKYLLIVIAVLLPDWLIWKRYFSGRRRTLSWLWWLPTLLLALCAVGAVSGLWHTFFMRATYYLALFCVIPKLVFATFMYISRKLAFGMVIITWLLFIYGMTTGFYRLTLRCEVYQGRDVPAEFDGYRIVHLSDIHIGSFGKGSDYLREVVDSVNALGADLIVVTGDLINEFPEELPPYMSTLSLLKAKDGVYSIMGNHDYGFEKGKTETNAAVIDSLETAMGWKMLNNSHDVIRRGADSLYILGVENISRSFFVSRGDLSKAFSGTAKEGFKILLTHDPHHWDDEVEPLTNINLTLAGHTHGMQFKIGRLSPARFMFKHWSGIYTSDDGQAMNVSEGIGGMFPLRLGAWPEIVLITLRHTE